MHSLFKRKYHRELKKLRNHETIFSATTFTIGDKFLD